METALPIDVGLREITMTVEERVRSALRSTQPAQALRALVNDLADEGQAKPQIVELIENFLGQQRMQADFRDVDEDALLDVLDALNGWCHPKSELLPPDRK
jgi:hypothetical protein